MISAIRAIVNHQNITDSISNVKGEVVDTQQHTDYINNFLAPYLKSDYAPYFFAHENNQIFPGEKIISIISISSDTQNSSGGAIEGVGSEIIETGGIRDISLPQNQWNIYLNSIKSSIQRGYENFL